MVILCQDFKIDQRSPSDEWLEMSVLAATEIIIGDY